MSGPLYLHNAAPAVHETEGDPSWDRRVPAGLHHNMTGFWELYGPRFLAWCRDYQYAETVGNWWIWLNDQGRPPSRYAPPVEWHGRGWTLADSNRWHRMFAPWVARKVDPYSDHARAEFDRARRAAAADRARAEGDRMGADQ